MIDLAKIRFVDGLVPVIAQDHVTGRVLMLAWANEEALRISQETGRMTYWSRSRGELWEKGLTSGHTQRLVSLALDCDQDAVLASVEQRGPACHTGAATCWGDGATAGFLGALQSLARSRQAAPQARYTDRLLAEPSFVAAKIEEEAAEVGAVLRGDDNEDSLEHEAADLLYHLIVGLQGAGADLEAVLRELRARHGDAGP